MTGKTCRKARERGGTLRQTGNWFKMNSSAKSDPLCPLKRALKGALNFRSEVNVSSACRSGRNVARKIWTLSPIID